MLRRSYAVVLALGTLIMLGQAQSAAAKNTLPFKGVLAGSLVSRTPIVPPVVFDVFEIEGHATHLGAYQLILEAVVDFGNLPPVATGNLTFIAANGDTLAADFTGSSTLVLPGLVLITERATIDPVRSTGRFAGATGAFTIERLADAATGVNGLTDGSFQGTISLAPHR